MDPDLLLGARQNDDAAVYRLAADLAIVQSIDLITPIVDDPYAFGQIAAANALSDLYAKGAQPLLALNVIGFPAKTLPLSMMEDILRGGADKLREAGAHLVGGHSILDDEPKYGMAVTGIIHPNRIVTKAGGRPGDALVITKPLGTGIITTAIDLGIVAPAVIERVTAQMTMLNNAAASAMLRVGVHAATDVTGFGLVGHLHELAIASGVAAEVDFSNVAVLPEVRHLVTRGAVPDGTRNNHRFAAAWIDWGEVPLEHQLILSDAQTSGGLLIAVSQEKKYMLLQQLASAGITAVEIGHLVAGRSGAIAVAYESEKQE